MRKALIRIALLAVLAAGLTAAAALADQTATVTSSNHHVSHGTQVTVDVQGSDPAAAGQVPHSVAVKAARGFKVDTRAVAKLCTSSEASSNSCPSQSRIGGGQATITVNGPSLPPNGQYTATADLFLAHPQQSGDVAGVVLELSYLGYHVHTIGRLLHVATGPFGVETLFDALDKYSVPAGYSAKLDSIHVTFGVHRTVKRKRKGKKPKKVRHDLIRNPSKCSGHWPWEVVVTYPSSYSRTFDGSLPCTSP